MNMNTLSIHYIHFVSGFPSSHSFVFFSPLVSDRGSSSAVYRIPSMAPDRESWWPGGPRRAQSVARWVWILMGWLMSDDI